MAITVAEVISDNFVDPQNNALSIGGTLSVEAISLFGTILLAGFLCRLVGQDKNGGPATQDGPATHHGTAAQNGMAAQTGDVVTLVVVLRTLPWISLIVADVLLAAMTIAGLALLVIPGLIVFTLFAVVGPAMEIEDRKPLSGLRRSAHLARQHFWTVALLATLPQIGLALAASVLPSPHGALHIFEVIVIRGIVLAPFEAAFGLVLVALCYRLIGADAAGVSAKGRASG
jgi:hypothetical protein